MLLILWLTLLSMRSQWPLMVAAAFGVLLAVTVMAGTVLYSEAQSEAGLRYVLAPRASTNLLSLKVIVPDRPLGRSDYRHLSGVVEGTIERHLDWLHVGGYRLGHSRPMPVLIGPERRIPFPDNLNAYVFFQGDLKDNARLIEGRWPEKPIEGGGSQTQSIEVVIGVEPAARLGWKQGDKLHLVPFEMAPKEYLSLIVVGVIEAIDPQAAYWFGDNPRLTLKEQDPIDQDDAQFLVPIFVEETDFFERIGSRYPMLLANYWWYAALDVTLLTASTVNDTMSGLANVEDDLARAFPRADALSQLDSFLTTYGHELTAARIPVFIFSSLVVGTILYYLVLISWLLARRRGPEIALLRSRGAGRLQIIALLGLGEGLMMAVPVVMAGPFVALALVRLISAGELDTDGFRIGLSPSVFAISSLGGLACVVVFSIMGINAASRNTIEFLRERARPNQAPTKFRLAADLFILGILGLVWYQIQSHGGFLTEQLEGEGFKIDALLLAGPSISLLATGLIILRILPYGFKFFGHISQVIPGVWPALSLARMGRDPTPYCAIAVLLMLVTGVGVFGASLGPTLIRGQIDQVSYGIGGEFVIDTIDERAARYVERQLSRIAATPGVEGTSSVKRGNLVLTRASSGGTKSDILWLDPSTIGRTSWWRADFAEKDIDDLLEPLTDRDSERRSGPIVLETADRIGMWVRPQRATSGYNFWVRLMDDAGFYESVLLGRLDFDTWTYMEAALPDFVHLTPPFSLAGFYITGSVLTGFGAGSLAVDEVAAIVGQERRVVEPFEALGAWEPMPNLAPAQDTIAIEQSAAYSGTGGLRYRWIDPPGLEPRGFFISPVPLPLPAIGGPSFAPGQRVFGRIEAQPVLLEIKEVVDYFPTLDPAAGPFLLVDMDGVRTLQRFMPRSRPSDPTEFWFGLGQGDDKTQALSVLEEVVRLIYPYGTSVDRELAVLHALDNPLIVGVWNGLPWIALIALAGVAVFGLVFHSILFFERNRIGLGLLRVLGLTRGQLGLLLITEGSLVIGIGTGLGAILGLGLGQWVIGHLDFSIEGRHLLPPLSPIFDGRLVACTLLSVVLAFAMAVLVTTILLLHLRLSDTLQIEE